MGDRTQGDKADPAAASCLIVAATFAIATLVGAALAWGAFVFDFVMRVLG